MAHQFRRVLLFADLDVFHKLLFGLVPCDFHDGDGRNTRQIHIRCSAAAGCMRLNKVAFLNNACLLFPFLYIGNLDLLDNACFPRNLFDEFVDFLFVGFRQLVSVFIQYCLQFGAYGDNDMIARLLLFQVDNLLSALQRADIALVDGR